MIVFRGLRRRESSGKRSASERSSTWKKSAENYLILSASSHYLYTSSSIHLFNYNSTQTGPPLYGKGKKLKILKYLEIQTSAGKGLDRQGNV